MIRHFERITQSPFLPRWLVHEHQARYDFCRERVGGKITVDCGSGEGHGSRAIAEGGPRMLVAVDIALPAVAMARGGRIVAVTAKAQQLALRDASADVVVALEVIEHIPDPDGLVAEASRILRGDGVFICSTPNRTVRNPRLPLSSPPLNPFHLVEWTTAEFRDMLAAKFAKVELFGQEPQPGFVTAVFDLASRIVSRRGSAILRQLVKFPLLLVLSRRSYRVQPARPDRDYEFIVAVCSEPRTAVAD